MHHPLLLCCHWVLCDCTCLPGQQQQQQRVSRSSSSGSSSRAGTLVRPHCSALATIIIIIGLLYVFIASWITMTNQNRKCRNSYSTHIGVEPIWTSVCETSTATNIHLPRFSPFTAQLEVHVAIWSPFTAHTEISVACFSPCTAHLIYATFHFSHYLQHFWKATCLTRMVKHTPVFF